MINETRAFGPQTMRTRLSETLQTPLQKLRCAVDLSMMETALAKAGAVATDDWNAWCGDQVHSIKNTVARALHSMDKELGHVPILLGAVATQAADEISSKLHHLYGTVLRNGL